VALGALGSVLGGSPLENLLRQLMAVAAPAVAVPLALGLSPARALGPFAASPRQIAGAALIGASWWVFALLCVLPLAQAVLPSDDGELARVAKSLLGDRPHPAAVLVGVVAAPAIAEELLFRGLLTGAVWRRYGPVVAVAASSVLFSLFHPPAPRMLLALTNGIILGVVFVRSGSVVASMVTHAVHNAMVLLIVPALTGADGQSGDLVPADTPLIPALPLTVAAATILIGFRGLGHTKRDDFRAEDKMTRLR